ncbi:DUF4214 domain-containing protein [Pseudomonas lactis]|nr:DUF4214 domain-containing protein [Pseudomonas lactis]
MNLDIDSTYIITSYNQNVLNRAPDARGLKCWVDVMASDSAMMRTCWRRLPKANAAPALDDGLWLS